MKRKEYTDIYKEAWRLWPGRWDSENDRTIKVGKWDAFLEWEKLTVDDHEDIIKVLKTGKVRRGGTRYLPDFNRWLKRKRWDDFS